MKRKNTFCNKSIKRNIGTPVNQKKGKHNFTNKDCNPQKHEPNKETTIKDISFFRENKNKNKSEGVSKETRNPRVYLKKHVR